MKKDFIVLFSLFSLTFANFAYSQPIGNEWIDFSKTHVKFKIAEDGVYRIPFNTLNNIPGLNLATVRGSDFVLYNYGEAVAIFVSTNNFFGVNDFIEFYGKKNDGRLDRQFYPDPDRQHPNPYFSLSSDTNVYFLTWQTGIPKNLINITNDLTNLPPKESFCKQTNITQFTTSFNPGKVFFSSEPLFRAGYDDGEGFQGGILFSLGTPNVAFPLNTDGFVNSGNATLRFGLTGISRFEHTTAVRFNNIAIWDTTYFGYSFNIKNFVLSQSTFLNNNELNFSASGSGISDNNILSFIEFTYNRNFNFTGKSTAQFDIAGSVGSRFIEITDFDNLGANLILYDLTNNARIVASSSGLPYQFKLPSVSNIEDRKILLISEALIKEIPINSMQPIQFKNFNDFSNQCNFCIISTAQLFNDGSGNNWVEEYRRYRETQPGGSWVSRVIEVEELYDQFAYGIRKHPLAIRNFSRSAMNNWVTKPEYFFLIGKGRGYDQMRFNQAAPNSAFNQCMIPTFGNKGSGSGGSDIMLTASPNSIVPAVPVGRLSVVNGGQVKIYLDKMKDFEDHQFKTGDPYQTIDNKLWTKNVLHLGGGTNQNERTRFANYLGIFQETILCELYGANVKPFLKSSIDPIQIGFAQDINDRLSKGVSLVTFFGHSSSNTFDISVDNPNEWGNFKKYPLVISNGCFTGNIFNATLGISEDYVLAQNRGAIGFLSTVSLSSAVGLFHYSNSFYNSFGNLLYNQPIGQVMKKASSDLESNFPNDVFTLMIAEEMTLNGDPSIKLNTYEKPDYVLEPKMVSFVPEIVNVDDPTFIMRVVVPNIGKAINVSDSIILKVERLLPNGTTENFDVKMPAPCYTDTIDVVIPTGSTGAFGLNNFILKIESQEKIDEISETNNTIGVQLTILSDDIFPIYPYEFAIINTDSITLAASTANTFAPERTYKIEIDTTELFNSSFKRGESITMTGGLLKWKLPFLLRSLPDSTVYYWRVGLDSTVHPNSKGFNNTSFVYLPQDSPGWNQSHFFQFKKDEFTNIVLDTDRKFKFISDIKEVSVITGKCLSSSTGPITVSDCQQIGYTLNGGNRERLVCGGRGYPRGLTVVVIDSLTGEPWKSKWADVAVDPCSGFLINNVHKNIHCNPGTPRDFDAFNFPVNSIVGSCPGIWEQRFINFINAIPDGNFILIYSVSVGTNIDYAALSPALINAISGIGSQSISQLPNFVPGTPWAFFTQKGVNGFVPKESVGTTNDKLTFTVNFEAKWFKGSFKSPLIGPAFKWKQLFWESYPFEIPDFDNSSIDIIGVRPDKTENVIFSNITSPSFSLATVNPNTYPFIRLRFNTGDDSLRTPSQLNYWKIIHDIVPEAALAPNIFLEFDTSVALGENINMKVAIENVSPVDMDSLLVKYTINSSGNSANITFVRFDSLKAGETKNIDFLFNTNCNCLSELNTLIVEANPDDDQPEQFHFNNIGLINFKTEGDNKNPLLDVTFDGVHILNGDLISAKPEIVIKLKDENKFLALNDTSLIKIFLRFPDGSLELQSFEQAYMTFTPATPSLLQNKNEATVQMRKTFDLDGIYELQVQANDRSRNASGTFGDPAVGIDYRISFEINNKASISNVLNYPNPFSTSTKFIFTLTGSETPSFMKIQIMTITGKVVREIGMDELGPLRIGRNITEFSWDGRDQYGDRLANGLYFYRVVASLNGFKLDQLETSSIDKFFKSGLGKMYLIK